MLWRSLLAAALVCCLAPLPAAQAAPDWPAIAGTYPQLGSLPSREELAIMHWLQDTRTRADVARADVESHPDLDGFLGALGGSADASDYPATVALLKQAKDDMKPVVKALKAQFGRPRPFVSDTTLAPALPEAESCSFPSKHATEGILFASLLSQLDPADQATLLEEGGLIGNDRVMAGLHWPSDVAAGQRLGKAFAAYWLGLPENAGLLEDAAAEWNAGGTRVTGGSPVTVSGPHHSSTSR
jgi:hypothetical protein